MKEYVIREGKRYTTWRIYKRLIKVGGKIESYVIVNLSVSHDRKRFYFTKITPNGSQPYYENYYFRLTKNGVLVSYKEVNDGMMINTQNKIYTVSRLFSNKRPFSRYTQRKINRILKTVFPELKIKNNTIEFLHSRLHNHSPMYKQFMEVIYLGRCGSIRKQIAESKSVKELCYKCIRLKGKKVVKALIEHPKFLQQMAELSKIKRYLSHGVVNNIIDLCIESCRYHINIHSEMNVLLKFRPKWVNYITDINKHYNLYDICRMINSIEDHEFTQDDFKGSIEEVHDRLSIMVNKQRYKNYECEEYFPPMKDGDLLIELPKDTHEILSWGSMMGHCIGSYTHSHRSKREIVGAVKKGNKIVANFSMIPLPIVYPEKHHRWSLRQLLGKGNQTLPEDLFDKVLEIFERHDILSKEQDYTKIWGYPKKIEYAV